MKACPQGGWCRSSECLNSSIASTCHKDRGGWSTEMVGTWKPQISKEALDKAIKIVEKMLIKQNKMTQAETQERLKQYEAAMKKTQSTLMSILHSIGKYQRASEVGEIYTALNELYSSNEQIEANVKENLLMRSVVSKLTRDEAQVVGRGMEWDRYVRGEI